MTAGSEATIPMLDDFALARRSTPLASVLRAEIEAAGGRITFARFMALAVGHPDHGYYARSDLRWGRDGDFETSPEVHPIFGYLWARQVAECWDRLGRPTRFDLVEPGAGTGSFSVAILTWLRERAPECFAAVRPWVLDGHPRRIEEQRAALQRAGFEIQHALLDDWLRQPDPIEGVVISNELFDALPVHLVRQEAGALREWYVHAAGDGTLHLELGEPSTEALAAHLATLGVSPGEGCNAEVCLAAPELMASIARRIRCGYIITIDYGYEAADLYAPWRREGTLLAFRDHNPQPDPLTSPGLIDLTAHVDFTSLAAAATREGFDTAPLTTQAEALIALGLWDAVEAARARMGTDFGAFAAARRAADTLIEPGGLGRIRIQAVAKDAPLIGMRYLAEATTSHAP
jgi:SAM-dependent MidA family methyltransferase